VNQLTPSPATSVPQAPHTYAVYVQDAPGAYWVHVGTFDSDLEAYRDTDEISANVAIWPTGYAASVLDYGTKAGLTQHYGYPPYFRTHWASDTAPDAPPPSAAIQHLNAVVTSLVTAHPEAAVRIARGADLVEAGMVEPTYGGIYLVYSQSEPARAYALVQDRGRWLCDCPDATQRGQACKHGFAALIFHTCERLHAEQRDPTPRACATCGEPLPDGTCPDCEPIPYALTTKALAYLGGAA
jgi:hypothetical protein